jgi:SAM-dependent methyltransferase
VQGDARRLPFRDGCFRAVIANHSLEHLEELDLCLAELKRVLAVEVGMVYVAVPDASTLSDRVYRWLSHGGGHINAIVDSCEFGRKLERCFGVPLIAKRVLHSSFAFANRGGVVKWSRRVYLIGGGYEGSLRLWNWLFRWLDRGFGTRLSVYGWAFYLGRFAPPDEGALGNVCLRCGAAHVSAWLEALGTVKRGLAGRWFACPDCGASNAFTDD